MKIHQYNQALKWIKRPSDKITKERADKFADKLGIKKEDRLSNGSTKTKPMPILKYISAMNKIYGNGDEYEDPRYIDPLEMQKIKEAIPVSPMVKKKKKTPYVYESWSDGIEKLEKEKKLKVAGFKDSSLYKLLENPKVLGVELGHDTIMNVIELIRNSGIVKKPEKNNNFKFVDILPLPKEEPKKIVAAVEDPIDHITLLEKNFS